MLGCLDDVAALRKFPAEPLHVHTRLAFDGGEAELFEALRLLIGPDGEVETGRALSAGVFKLVIGPVVLKALCNGNGAYRAIVALLRAATGRAPTVIQAKEVSQGGYFLAVPYSLGALKEKAREDESRAFVCGDGRQKA